MYTIFSTMQIIESPIISYMLGQWASSSYKLLGTLIASFLGLLLIYMKRNTKKNETNGFNIDVDSLRGPKPFIIPYIGNAFDFMPYRGILPKMLKWSYEYGNLYKFSLAGNKLVMLNSPETAQALLKPNNLGLVPKLPLIYNEFGTYVPTGLIVAKGQFWKTNRKFIMQSMSIQSLKSYMPLVNKHSKRLVQSMDLLFQDGKTHTLNKLISLTFFDVIVELITGWDMYVTDSEERDRYHRILLKTNEIFATRVLQPWLHIDFIWKYHPLSKAQAEIREVSDQFPRKIVNLRREVHDAKKKNPDAENVNSEEFRCLVDILLDEGVPDEQIMQDLMVMLIAGHETTSAGLHFFCFMMALHPEYQSKCREEVDRVCGKGHDLTWEVMNELKYLEWAISETLRMYPPIFIFGRLLEEPVTFEDKSQLAPGTNVLVMPWALHRNPEHFPNPDKFDPNRFSPEETEKRPPCAYMPFGVGQRNCLALKFAMIELKVGAAHILQAFELSTKQTIDEIALLPQMLLKPEKDYDFTCTRRAM